MYRAKIEITLHEPDWIVIAQEKFSPVIHSLHCDLLQKGKVRDVVLFHTPEEKQENLIAHLKSQSQISDLEILECEPNSLIASITT